MQSRPFAYKKIILQKKSKSYKIKLNNNTMIVQ